MKAIGRGPCESILLVATLAAVNGGGAVAAGSPQIPVTAEARSSSIVTWGSDTPAWAQRLQVGSLREGCSGDDATSCVTEVGEDATREGANSFNIAFVVASELTQLPAIAASYSVESLSDTRLTEISFDDFASTVSTWYSQYPRDTILTALDGMLNGAKSANPHLKFGVTIYEDEVENPSENFLDDSHVPASVKGSIDYVHLYLHYRKNASKYPQYVLLAKTLFPNAKIIAGSYPYDRIDYISCAEGSQTKCTASQEVSLFAQSLRIQTGLLAEGAVAAVEFYPGYFGSPAAIFATNGDDNACNPTRLTQCVGNTRTMQQDTATILDDQRVDRRRLYPVK